jgi:hypothetical protein
MAIDKGFGFDHMAIQATAPMVDSGRERTKLVVQKWDEEQTNWAFMRFGIPVNSIILKPHHFAEAGVKPYEEFTYNGNLITQAGWGQLFKAVTVGSPTLFSATVGRIGIGTSVSAAAATDTALGSVASLTGNNWKLCGALPTVTSAATPGTVVFVATFGATDAVGAWNEFAVDQGTSSAGPTVTATAPMMNHSTNIGAGTKAGGTWTATATLSFT